MRLTREALPKETIYPHSFDLLITTATPHKGYQESLAILLKLLVNQCCPPDVIPNRGQLEAVMVRLLKSEVMG